MLLLHISQIYTEHLIILHMLRPQNQQLQLRVFIDLFDYL